MAEQNPEPTFAADEPEQMGMDELVVEVRTLRNHVNRLNAIIEPREALLRAQADIASGKLHSDAPARTRKPSSAEAKLWS